MLVADAALDDPSGERNAYLRSRLGDYARPDAEKSGPARYSRHNVVFPSEEKPRSLYVVHISKTQDLGGEIFHAEPSRICS